MYGIFDILSHTSAASRWSSQISLLVVLSKFSVLNSGSWVLGGTGPCVNGETSHEVMSIGPAD